MSRKRIFWIDFAKGFTIFLVVLAHTLANINSHVPIQNTFNKLIVHVIMYFCFLIIMPLFFAISGYLYKSVDSFGSYIFMLKKKVISLGIPYALFSVILVLFSEIGMPIQGVSGINDLFWIFIKPISYLWFLYSLFIAFLIVGFFDLLKIKMSIQLSIYFILTIIFESISNNHGLFYLYQSFSWVLCFYIGYFFSKLRYFEDRRYVIICLLLFLSCFVQMYIDPQWYVRGDFFLPVNTISKICSIPIFFHLFSKATRKISVASYFSKWGGMSLVIYLVHVPIISILRKVFVLVNITEVWLLIFIITLVSWYLSILICKLVKKVSIIDFLFFPLNYIRLKKLN